MTAIQMATAYKWIVALGSILFVLTLSAFVRPEFACLILSGFVLVAVVVCLASASIMGLLKWRKLSTLWPLPALVCAAFILSSFYIAPSIGRRITDSKFKKNIGDYARVVGDFGNGSVRCSGSCDGIVKVLEGTTIPPTVRDIWGAHCGGSSVVVLFLMKTDVPLLHEGYMFKDYKESSDCSERFGSREFAGSRFRYVRQIEGNWYRFSDQPGF